MTFKINVDVRCTVTSFIIDSSFTKTESRCLTDSTITGFYTVEPDYCYAYTVDFVKEASWLNLEGAANINYSLESDLSGTNCGT